MPKYSAIPYHRRDNAWCLACDINRTYFHDGVWYSLCKTCLKDKELGPYRSKLPRNGDDYAD